MESQENRLKRIAQAPLVQDAGAEPNVTISTDDFYFLLRKANLTLLVQEENKTLRWMMEDNYLGKLQEHIRLLEAENHRYLQENEKLKKQK